MHFNCHRIGCTVTFKVRGSVGPKEILGICTKRNISSFHFDYERIKGNENARWLQLTGQQAIGKFLPVTRKALLQSILEDVHIIRGNDLNDFQHLATAIDSTLYAKYKKELDDLKSLYNPLSPDRDTVQLRSFSTKELSKRENKLLMKLSGLLKEASFYELPKDVMLDALGENNVAEKMIVNVSPENYETLKFWVIGMDVVPLDERPWYIIAEERARFINQRSVKLDPLAQHLHTKTLLTQILSKLWKKLYGENAQRIARYKRVIVAVRMKEDEKLLIKAFKDIPCENLEFLLPEGKIKMKKLDKIRLFVQSSFIIFFIICTALTNLDELKMEMSLFLGIMTAIILIRNAIVYKNLRNRCILDLSQTLYFKSVANNHALLALIVDRAEDEIYKYSLLTYAFLHKNGCFSDEVNVLDASMTESELKNEIENWLRTKYDIKVNLSIGMALRYLKDLKLINSRFSVKGTAYYPLSLKDARISLPQLKRPPLLHHADLLNINFERAATTETERKSAHLSHEGLYDWE